MSESKQNVGDRAIEGVDANLALACFQRWNWERQSKKERTLDIYELQKGRKQGVPLASCFLLEVKLWRENKIKREEKKRKALDMYELQKEEKKVPCGWIYKVVYKVNF